MKKVSAAEALAATRANSLSRWKGADNSAAFRLRNQICIPYVSSSFTIGRDDKIFAIGSCFARNVEEQLATYHSDPLSLRISIPGAEITSARETGIVNKFNVLSMEQELSWAANASQFPKEAFIRGKGGEYYDPHIRRTISVGSVDDLTTRRKYIQRYFAKSLCADVFIITLGLAEFWFDEDAGLALNEAPDPVSFKNYPTRFSFCVDEVPDVLASLERIRGLVLQHGKPGCKIVITTSPVPFGRTFTAHDVIVANMTSKSILRTASVIFADRHSDVDYYPSYDGALLSDRKIVWEDDQLHVSDFMVGQLIRTFLTRYGVSVAEVDEEVAPELPQDHLLKTMRKQISLHKTKTIRLEKELAELRRAYGIAAE